MGGHGALTLAMRHPGRYVSASAFAPIVNPADTPWGQQAFAAYLGEAREAWLAHDASQLMATVAHRLPLRVDQGGGDSFLPEQLQPEVLCAAAKAHGWALDYTLHPDYDHSYYFIASLIEAHLRFHAGHLAKAG
jgi:S-formylglutathione hydrolase